jgi:N-ethylmaleimide reductase
MQPLLTPVLNHVESDRVGIKVGPMHLTGPFVANPDTLPGMEYVIKRLNDYRLAHLLMMGSTSDFTGTPLEGLQGDRLFEHFRPLYKGHFIANVDMTQERANRLITAGIADSIAFARTYIANPDLPERFLTSAQLNEINWPTVYASGPKGYIDYPRIVSGAIN